MDQAGKLFVKSLKDQVSPQEWEARVHLAACYRLVAHYGMSDMMANHITLRVPGEENAFLLVTNQGACSFSSQRPGVIEEIPIEQAVALQLQIYPIGPLVDYLANGHIVSLMEKEFLEEKKCFKIKLKTKTGVEMLFWISAKTYLIKKSSIRKQGEGASETQTLYHYQPTKLKNVIFIG